MAFVYDGTDLEITGGTSGNLEDFADLHDYDVANILTVLNAGVIDADPDTFSLGTALQPADSHQMRLTISASADRAGAEMDIVGTDLDGNAISENEIDIATANATPVVTILKFATVDSSGITVRGMTNDDTITITQPRKGIVWEIEEGKQYYIENIADFAVGDDSTETHFGGAENVLFAGGVMPRSRSNANLTIGGRWILSPDATLNMINNGETGTIIMQNGAALDLRTNWNIAFFSGTLDLSDCSIILNDKTNASNLIIFRSNLTSHKYDNVLLENTSLVQYFSTPDEMNQVRIDNTNFGVSANESVTLRNTFVTNYTSTDFRAVAGKTLTLINCSSVKAPQCADATANIIEQHTFDVQTKDTDGVGLEGVDVDAKYAHLVEGDDNQTHICTTPHTSVSDANDGQPPSNDGNGNWTLFNTGGGLGGDWNAGFVYQAAQTEFSTATTVDGLKVTGDLFPNINDDYANIGLQGAVGKYDPTQTVPNVYTQIINGQVWYNWADDTDEWYRFTTELGVVTSPRFARPFADGRLGDYAFGTGSGIPTVRAISGLIPQQPITTSIFVGTNEIEEKRLHTVTYTHADYPIENIQNVIVDKPTDWKKEMAITKQDLADTVWDELLTGGTHNIQNSAGKRLRQIQENLGYELGAVWLDSVNGSEGTENFENGTIGTKSKLIDEARTIANSLKLNIFEISPGSSFTLDQAYDNFSLRGDHWILALNGKSISASAIKGAEVTGTAIAASQPHFFSCEFGNVTLPSCHLNDCSIEGTITLADAGDYFFDQCYSAIAGTATPSIDFQSGVGSTNLNIRHYSGGIEIKNMGGAGTDNMSLEGNGQLIINANCSGGTIAIRGNFTVTDNASGAVTLSDDARYDIDQPWQTKTITAGGTRTAATIIKIIAAGIAGDKSLSAGVTTVKDIDDDTSVYTYTIAATGTIVDVTIT